MKPTNSINDDRQTSALVSFIVAQQLTKQKKTLGDGENLKEILAEIMKVVFGNTAMETRVQQFFTNLPLSRRTIMRRVTSISENLRLQLLEDLGHCEYFSFQLDESTDVSGHAQVAVFLRMVFKDLFVRDEFFAIFPLKTKTTGEEIYKAMKEKLSSLGVPIQKLASITSDGAPSMTGSKSGFIARCRGDAAFPKFHSFHCLLHQLALCAKKISLDNVINLVVQIVNSIISKPLQHRLYNVFKAETQSESPNLRYYAEVRWLSKGIMLERFFENLADLNEFIKQNKKEYPELNDPLWLSRLAYLVDLTQLFNVVNKEMQGNSKFIWKNIDSINSLKNSLRSSINSFNKNVIPFIFPRLKDLVKKYEKGVFDGQFFGECSQKIYDEMDARFSDINETAKIYQFLLNPIDKNVDAEQICEDIVNSFPVDNMMTFLEIEQIRNNSELRMRFNCSKELWKYIVDNNLYPNLASVYKRMCSFFGTSYLCETAISHMKHMKSSERSLLTDDHLNDSMLVALSGYKPDLQNLANADDAQNCD